MALPVVITQPPRDTTFLLQPIIPDEDGDRIGLVQNAETRLAKLILHSDYQLITVIMVVYHTTIITVINYVALYSYDTAFKWRGILAISS